jgi:hypothetical protein
MRVMSRIGLTIVLAGCVLAAMPSFAAQTADQPSAQADDDVDQPAEPGQPDDQAAEQTPTKAPDWNTLADCATGYLANWKNRQGRADRTKEMGDMIRAQSDQYKAAAAKAYQTQASVPETEAKQFVDMYVDANLDRFVMMDKAGELESFIDECPQTDDSDQD